MVKSIQAKLYFILDDEPHPDKIVLNGRKEIEAFIKKHRQPMDDIEIFQKKYLELMEEIMRFKDRFVYDRESARSKAALEKRDELRVIC